MPEGHTIHRLAKALRPMVGSTITAMSPQGRFAEGAAAIDGGVLRDSQAFGKHLLLTIDAQVLHIHLGLAGSMFQVALDAVPTPGVRLRIVGGSPPLAWHLIAPIRCELLTPGEAEALVARLGPDPLRGDNPQPAFERIRHSGRTIGELLMDQNVIAGVGNVFRAEALHTCHIHPLRRGTEMQPEELQRLWTELTRLMRRAVREGRILTIDTKRNRKQIPDQEGRFVYKQEQCRTCGAPVRSWQLGSRTAYACESCQPEAA